MKLEKLEEEYPNIQIEDHLGTDTVKIIEELKSPRFIKTHLALQMLPEKLKKLSTKTKIIYVCRDPKDVCVSLFYYSKHFLGHTCDFDMFQKMFLQNMRPFGPFWDHVLQFWDLRNNPNVIFLRYEDLDKDLLSVIRKTASFLGKSLTENQVSSLTDHLSFESMKKNPAVNRKSRVDFHKKYNIITEVGEFIRSGCVGGWKRELTPEMIEEFDSWTKQNTAGTSFAFPC